MRKLIPFLFLLITFFCASCTSEALRNEEKFSRAKKYALIPFNCKDMELSDNLAKELKERLLGDDYKIIESEKLDALLAQNKLTRKQVIENYSSAIARLTGVDGIITGIISLDKKSAEHQMSASTSGGGNISYISSCEVLVVDVLSGEVLARANYNTPATVLTSGSQRVDEIARNISLQLSPH